MDEPSAPPRRRRLWPWLLAAAVLVVAWIGLAGLLLLDAKSDAEAGRDRLTGLRSAGDPADALLHGGADTLRLAAADFHSARRAVRSPIVSPLRALPIVGRQLRAFDSMATSAGRVAEAGGEALDRIDDRVASGTAAGGERVELMREIAGATAEVQEALGQVDLGPDEALFRPLADARAEFDEELTEVRSLVDDARVVADGLLPMFEGPSRYLVLGANNAEMQISAGMPLSIGVMEVRNGQLDLPAMTPAADLRLPAGAAELDPDTAALWGFLGPDRDFRALGLTPRFDVTGAQAARMWAAAGNGEVDGVLMVDPIVLRALLGASGAIAVDGVEFTADNVVDHLLHQQYVDFQGDQDTQDARRDRLGRVAAAAVDNLDGGGWDVAALATDLADAARGRHVLAWSRHPEQQAAWEAAGVAGTLEEDGVYLGFLNLGGAKNDPFIDVSADVAVAGDEVTVRIAAENRIPEGEPGYVLGPAGDGRTPGDYDAFLSVTIPGYAEGAQLDDSFAPPTGRDGARFVLTTRVFAHRGERVERVLRFRVPDVAHRLHLEPTARIPEIRWTAQGQPAESGDRIEW